jgi:hypothetical protein
MRRWLRSLDAYWFPEAPAARLGVLRVLTGGYAVVYLARRIRLFERVAQSAPSLYAPVGVVRVRRRPLPARLVRATVYATLAASVAFTLGRRHRASGPAFGGLLLWLLCYRNSWSMVFHSDNVLVFHVITLGLTPAADAVSLDALARSRSGRGPAILGPAPHWRYGWPIRLMSTVTLATYFLAGVAKVAGPLGWGWASGEALRAQIAVDGVRKEVMGGGAAPLAWSLYDKVWLFRLMGVGSLVTELGAPVVLTVLDRREARVWAIGTWGMHWGIYAVMKIVFRYQLSGIIYASFFDVERPVVWLVDRLADRPGEGR